MAQSRIDRDEVDVFDGVVDSLEEIRRFIEFNEDREDAAQGRKDDSKMVYDYYWGNRQLDLLTEEMRNRFPRTWQTRRKATENVTWAIVNNISVVYKSPPKRIVTLEAEDGEDTVADSEVQREELQELYDKVIGDSKHDFNMQKLERYLNFDHTELVQIGYDEIDNKIVEIVMPQFMFDVILDEMGRLKVVIKSDFFGDEEHEDDRTYEVWTDTNFWKLDNDLAIIPQADNTDNMNPYGKLPFSFTRSFIPDQGAYCEASIELAQLNKNLNLLLSDALHLSEFQTHGQPLANNCKFAENQEFGPETVVKVEPENPDQPASFTYLTPDANFDGLFETINRILKGYTSTQGLPPNMFSFDRTSNASGVALKIHSAPLIELRESMEEKFRVIEDDIFDKIRLVWNFNAPNHGLGEFPENMKVAIAYKDASSAFETTTEKVNNMLRLFASNLIKATDIVMVNNPGFSREDAAKYLEEAMQEKMDLTQALTGPVQGAPAGNTPERSREVFRQVIGGASNNAVQPNQGQ